MLNASALPFAREINSLSFQWRPLEPHRLGAELRAAAELARRHLTEAARAIGVRQHFEVRRGDPVPHLTETCLATDVVVVAAPRRTNHHATRFGETTRRSAASVLFLPPGAGPARGPARGLARGPIIAVTTGAGDRALAVARSIAAVSEERLLILARDGEGDRLIPGTSVHDIATALAGTRERLIVVTRDGAPDGSELAAARGAPVLSVEPV